MSEIFIFIEITPNFKVAKVVFELSNVAQNLKAKLNDSKISAVIVGRETDYSSIIDSVKNRGFDKVYLLKNDLYSNYSSNCTDAICELIKEESPKIVLFGATRIGRDIAPSISAKLSLGLTADCTKLEINDQGQLEATRPTFGGNLMATILSKTEPQMATIRPNVFLPIEIKDSNNIDVYEKSYPIDDKKQNWVKLLDFIPFSDNEENSLANAKIIVAGGLGMKNKEGFKLLKDFADLIGGQIGASRKAVEKGLASPNIQIGQTGKTVMPDVYIACGISGAIQHTVGMNMAKKVIAINSDRNAPIFKQADYCIHADVFKILPKLIQKAKRRTDNE